MDQADQDRPDRLSSGAPLEQVLAEQVAQQIITTLNQMVSLPMTSPIAENLGPDKIAKLLLMYGQTSVSTTAELVETMLSSMPDEIRVDAMGAIGTTLFHHLFEVVGDSFDKGETNKPEDIALVQRICQACSTVIMDPASDPVSIAELDALVLATNPNANIDLARHAEKLAERLHLQLPAGKVTWGALIQMNIEGNRALATYINRVSEENPHLQVLTGFLKESLLSRYSAVEKILTPQTGYQSSANLEEAIQLREDSILIKVTMAVVAIEALKKVQIDNKILEHNLIPAMSMAAKLIGIYNDIGSVLAHEDPENIRQLFEILRKENPDQDPRDAIAPENYRVMVKSDNIRLDGLAETRASFTNYIDLQHAFRSGIFMQLLKDATDGEHNLVFDYLRGNTGKDQWTTFLDTLEAIRGKVTEYTTSLDAFLQQVPDHIAQMIMGTVDFHLVLYKGRDYYNDPPVIEKNQ